ncbi:multicilin, partial [Tachysurus ichikawai]
AFTSHPDNTSGSHQGSAFTTHTHSYFSSAEPSDRHFNAALQTSWLESLLNHTPPEEDECSHRILSEHTNAGVKRKLWPSDIESSSANNPADKKSRLDQKCLDQSEHQLYEQLDSETVQVFGSFRNFQVLKASPCATSDLWREGKRVFFKTSIREHSTVRTRGFPHGKTFTSHRPDGGCRFLWFPNQI